MVMYGVTSACAHGDGPHKIKVCITKTDNDPDVFAKLKSVVGEKPKHSVKKLLTPKSHKYRKKNSRHDQDLKI
jgi:hypothetical protein